MDSEEEPRAVAPFRHRHDGWTQPRQKQFLERLSETGCVSEACRAVGLSTTSAYRAYARIPAFADAWNRALAMRRPMLEDVAFERAIRGVTVPLTRLGQVVGERRQYSDTLLRFLIERGDRRERATANDAPPIHYPKPEETDALIQRRLDILAKHKRRQYLEFADRMECEGKAP